MTPWRKCLAGDLTALICVSKTIDCTRESFRLKPQLIVWPIGSQLCIVESNIGDNFISLNVPNIESCKKFITIVLKKVSFCIDRLWNQFTIFLIVSLIILYLNEYYWIVSDFCCEGHRFASIENRRECLHFMDLFILQILNNVGEE